MKFPKPQAMVSNDHPPVLCAREVCNNKPTVLYKSLGQYDLIILKLWKFSFDIKGINHILKYNKREK